MNAVENIENLVKKIFGIQIEIKGNKRNCRNNCTGALVNKDDFGIFRDNFLERLKRISTHFKDIDSRTKIANKIKELATEEEYGWAGYYSELVAIDTFCLLKTVTNIKIDNVFKKDINDSIAFKMGHNKINIDLSFELNKKEIYTDVKSLKSLNTEIYDSITNTIMERAQNELGIKLLIAVDDKKSRTPDEINEMGKRKEEIIEYIFEDIKNKREERVFVKIVNCKSKCKLNCV